MSTGGDLVAQAVRECLRRARLAESASRRTTPIEWARAQARGRLPAMTTRDDGFVLEVYSRSVDVSWWGVRDGGNEHHLNRCREALAAAGFTVRERPTLRLEVRDERERPT